MLHGVMLLKHCGNLYVSLCYAAYTFRNPLCSMLLKRGNLYVSSRINSLQTTKLNPGVVSVENNYVSSWINSLQTTKLNPGIVSVESNLCATIY